MLGYLEVLFFDQPPSVYTVVGDITDQGFGNWQQPENNFLNWNPVSKIQWSGVRKKVLLLMLTSIHLSLSIALRKKYPYTEFFLVRIFPHLNWIRRDTEYLSLFSPNVRKTPYLDTFHAVSLWITLAVPPLNWIDQSLKRRPWVHTLFV